MKILVLTKYGSKGASSRVRTLQYLKYLTAESVDFDVSPLFENEYLDRLYAGRPVIMAAVQGYLQRFIQLFFIYKYDCLLIEKELFPYLPALFERLLSVLRKPYVADYDDAIHHQYDQHRNPLIRKILGNKIDTVMRLATIVTAGNAYLAEKAERSGASRVELIPTVVDIDRYTLRDRHEGRTVIGWIGSPSTSKYLKDLLPVLQKLSAKYDVEVVAIGAKQEVFVDTPVKVLAWSEAAEVGMLQKIDIGVMPLPDQPWERGKCGYKLIQFMACGVPVVASPVGVNKQIIDVGVDGFLASTETEWLQALESMLQMTPQERFQMGVQGRQKVVAGYSVQSQYQRWVSLLMQAGSD